MNQPISTLILLRKKRCCGNSCINCPYVPKHIIGSSNTIHDVLLEPVSVLEYYGLNLRVINILESHGYYLINDLRNITGNTVIGYIGKKEIEHIKSALLLLLNGGKPKKLSFDNTD